MKKIVYLILTTFIAFMVSQEVKATCYDCQQPKICQSIGFSWNGCNISFEVCWKCDATGNNPHEFVVSQIQYNCPNYTVEQIKAEITRFILKNLSTFCGQRPCDIGFSHVRITHPICMTMHWDGSQITLEADPDNCYSICSAEYFWCWCNCTPDCDLDPNCTPHAKYWLTSSTPNPLVYNPTGCTETRTGEGTEHPFDDDPWTIDCQYTGCNPPESE
ncbi:MAG: hypothetical protein HW421_2421 [Ignavibacteria bacterium]|nr:hypothetical protein [Ignavibacteria bacterium]